MTLRALLASASVFLATASAMAADLPSRKTAPVAPAPAPQAFTWTGFYLGLNGGYGGDTINHPINFGRRTAPAASVGALDMTMNGGLIGAQIGYNYQIDSFVVGAEADFAFTNIEGTVSLLGTGLFPGGTGNGPRAANLSSQIDSIGTVRLRAGYAWEKALFYVTGGWAYGNVTGSINAPALGIDYSKSNMHSGWTLGAGIEYAFTNAITFKTEYLYADLGSATVYSNVYRTGTTVKLNSDVSAQIVRVGLNYKF